MPNEAELSWKVTDKFIHFIVTFYKRCRCCDACSKIGVTSGNVVTLISQYSGNPWHYWARAFMPLTTPTRDWR